MSSELGHDLLEEVPSEFVAIYMRLPNKGWKFSLRSHKGGVNVNQLAQYYGGSGHQSAAGFVVDNLEEL